MKQKRLQLYLIDMKYIRDLAKADDNVLSVSPQIGKAARPFVGIVIVCDTHQYCIPLSSPKTKHQSMKNDVDFTKIIDGDKIIAAKELNWCQHNQDAIIKKANKLYAMITAGTANNLLKKRCCDFKKLEQVLEKAH